jgi:4-amino-4-deoxy-L-arabinose transferase-like glycosyltransferase
MSNFIATASCRILILLALSMLLLRFWKLDASPPGFAFDEVIAAGTVSCFTQTGESLFGDRHPLFFDAKVGSPLSPVFVYLGTLWGWVFGTSISSFRGFAAFFGVLACVGAAGAAYYFRGRLASILALAVAALSPWSFQFSRIAWDAALAPAFVVFGVLCAIQGGSRWNIAAGFLLSLSAYAYPPLRVHAFLIVLGLLVFLATRKDRRGLQALLASTTLTSLPLAWLLAFGNLMSRYKEIGIFTERYRQAAAPHTHWYDYLQTFIGNYLKHFSYRYLFVSGDGNIVHSTQHFGELGWLDMLAVAAGIAMLVSFLWRRMRSRSEAIKSGRRLDILVWCAITGIVPAALTWESLPHALRTLAVWPFWAAIAGCLLAAFVKEHQWAAPVVLAVGLAFSTAFAVEYFEHYPAESRASFFGVYKDLGEQAGRTGDWTAYFRAAATLPPAGTFYYPVVYGGMRCMDLRNSLPK